MIRVRNADDARGGQSGRESLYLRFCLPILGVVRRPSRGVGRWTRVLRNRIDREYGNGETGLLPHAVHNGANDGRNRRRGRRRCRDRFYAWSVEGVGVARLEIDQSGYALRVP